MNICPVCSNGQIGFKSKLFASLIGRKVCCPECGSTFRPHLGWFGNIGIELILIFGFYFASPLTGLYYKSWGVFASVLLVSVLLAMLVAGFAGLRLVRKGSIVNSDESA